MGSSTTVKCLYRTEGPALYSTNTTEYIRRKLAEHRQTSAQFAVGGLLSDDDDDGRMRALLQRDAERGT